MSAKLVFVAAHLGVVVALPRLENSFAPAAGAGKQFLGVLPPSNAFQAIAPAPRAEDINMVARGTLSNPEWLEPRLEPMPESSAAEDVTKAAPNPMMPILSVKMSDHDFQDIERNIEKLVTSGEDPATRSAVKQLSATLIRTIIPIREEQMSIDQIKIDRLVGDIKHCSPEEKQRGHAELDERSSAVKEHKANFCDDYSACYKKEVQRYKDAEKKVKVRDDHRSLKTLYSIKCLVNAFDKGKVSKEEAKACKDKKYAQLTVRYPEVPSQEPCPSPRA